MSKSKNVVCAGLLLQGFYKSKTVLVLTLPTVPVKSYSATVDAPSDTVPSGQCLDYDGTLAICYVDGGLEVDSNAG